MDQGPWRWPLQRPRSALLTQTQISSPVEPTMTKPSPVRKPGRTPGALASEVLARVQGTLKPPSYIKLSAVELMHWDHIIEARPRSSWRPHEYTLVAQAAQLTAQLHKSYEQPTTSRTIKEQAALSRRQLALLRALRVIGARPLRAPELPPEPAPGSLLAGYGN